MWDAVVDARALATEASRVATRLVLGHEFPRTAADDAVVSGIPMAEVLGLLSDDRVTVAQLVEAYEASYLELVAGGVPVRPGWSALVVAARPVMSIAVVASERAALVEEAAAASGVLDDLDVLVCDTGAPERPPHPAVLLDVIERCGARTDTAWYVATVAADVVAARSAGVATIVLRTGAGASGGDPNETSVDRLDEVVPLLGLTAGRRRGAPAEPPAANPPGTDRSD